MTPSRSIGDPVPNQFPLIEPGQARRIALVGEAPGGDEDYYGTPFVGESGRILDSLLGRVGLPRNQCFVGNVCQHRPIKNIFETFAWDSWQVQQGVAQLALDLGRFKPTIVVCFGNAALHLFKHGNVSPPKKGSAYDWPCKITQWRGSLFWSEWLGVKCLAMVHPAAMVGNYSLQAYYLMRPGMGDFYRLKEECETRELELPQRTITIESQSASEAVDLIQQVQAAALPTSLDIEGGPGNVTSIAFANCADSALVVPLAHIDGTSVWLEQEEVAIWQAVKALVEDSSIVKIGLNLTAYDLFALAWTYGIVPAGPIHELMELWWELGAELKKGLATVVSLLTKQPFYKPDKEDGEMVFANDGQFWTYNGVDAAVTWECWARAIGLLSKGQQRHFRENCDLQGWKLYAMLRGLRVDKKRVKEKKAVAQAGVWELQALLNEAAGVGRELKAGMSERELAEVCLARLCGKRPRRREKVVIERWQPMRWDAPRKKDGTQKGDGQWKKDGKLIAMLVAESDRAIQDNGLCYMPSVGLWLKPMPKTIERLVAFTPAGLADLDGHVLDSKQDDWKRVKKLWKEMKNERRRETETIAEAGTSAVELPGPGGVDRQELAGDVQDDARADTGDFQDHGPFSEGLAALLGELSSCLGLAVNVSSNEEGGDTQTFLYETCALPQIFINYRGQLSRESEAARKARIGNKQRKGVKHGTSSQPVEGLANNRPSNDGLSPQEAGELELPGAAVASASGGTARAEEAGEAGEEVERPREGKRVTTAGPALARLYAITEDVRVLWVLLQRRLRKIVTDLSTPLDDDSRIRCSISFVKDTGRMAASESPLKTGTNLMALNKDLRSICVADEGYELGQVDFEGSDSWTVACECAALGDMTMLEDLRAGLKPAKVMCLVFEQGEAVNKLGRDELKQMLKANPPAKWLYAANKSGHHGFDYGMKEGTLITTVLKYSMADLPTKLDETKPVVLTKAQARKILAANASRYPGVLKWQQAEARAMLAQGYIAYPTGHVRLFYGRKTEIKAGRKAANHETWKSWLSSKPQYWTTRQLKVALARLWHDPENQREDGSFIVEALLTMHDALVMQWPKKDRTWAVGKIRQWFDNEVEIAGQKVVIPFDGTIGQDWGMEESEEL